MNVVDFAAQLVAAAPSIIDLNELGISSESAEEIIRCATVATRATPLPLGFITQREPDSLLELLISYDVAKLEIGIVSFLETPVDYGSYLHFARVELDPVVIGRSGEINVLDSQDPSSCLWQCAKDGASLLDALSMVNKLLTLRMLHDDIYENDAYALEVAGAAAASAGGQEYTAFYQMLFGV